MPQSVVNTIAERYVKLVLAVGQHDADYVDAFYGPPEWRAEASARQAPLAQLEDDTAAAIAQLQEAPEGRDRDPLAALRREYLRRQLEALSARVRMLGGRIVHLRRRVGGALRCGGADTP